MGAAVLGRGAMWVQVEVVDVSIPASYLFVRLALEGYLPL